MIVISLLTLVPGELGGSETYVRELLRGLAASGPPLPRARCRPPRRTPARDCPRSSPSDSAAAASLVAMARAAADPRSSRPFEAMQRRALPAHRSHPAVAAPGRGHAPRRPAPRPAHLFSRAERAYRSRRVRPRRPIRGSRARRQRVRPRPCDREARSRPRARRRDAACGRPRTVPSGRREARTVSALPRKAVAAQEPRRLFEAFALLRRERPDLRLVLTGGGTTTPYRRASK